VGLYVIRGENLVLLGELDMEKEARGTALREVPLDQILAQKAAQKQEKVLVCNRVFPCAARRRFGILTTGVHPPSSLSSLSFPPLTKCRRRMTYCERNSHNKLSASASKTASSLLIRKRVHTRTHATTLCLPRHAVRTRWIGFVY
jgi:hypothetical protein